MSEHVKVANPHSELTSRIIAAAIEVHRHLGPGLLESTYQACLRYELASSGLTFRQQQVLPITYKSIQLDEPYRLDFVVEEAVILELKSVDALHPIHEAQLLTYMKLSGLRVGLLINFNTVKLKEGLRRMVL